MFDLILKRTDLRQSNAFLGSEEVMRYARTIQCFMFNKKFSIAHITKEFATKPVGIEGFIGSVSVILPMNSASVDV